MSAFLLLFRALSTIMALFTETNAISEAEKKADIMINTIMMSILKIIQIIDVVRLACIL
jgi:hypothetical protein